MLMLMYLGIYIYPSRLTLYSLMTGNPVMRLSVYDVTSSNGLEWDGGGGGDRGRWWVHPKSRTTWAQP